MDLVLAESDRIATSRIAPCVPIRIAFVVWAFDTGGLERCVAHLINRLDPDRFECLVVSLTTNGAAREWVEREDVPFVELHKPPGNSLRTIPRRLAEVLAEHHVDIVHSHNWGTLLEAYLAVRRLRGVRHIHAAHGLELDQFRVRGWKRSLRRLAMGWMLNRTNAVVACADCVRDWICRECRVRSEKVELIPNGVDTPALDCGRPPSPSMRTTLGILETSFVFGSVGRLIELKDFGTCFRALARLIDRGVDAHFVLVGDGPLDASLREQSHAAGVAERVHFAGYQRVVGPWLQAMDVYVNSSLTEAMNMGILEAMAAGLPVVATDVGDAACLLNGEVSAGLVVPPADPDALAGALARLIHDPDLRAEFAVNALDRHQAEFTIERMVGRYAALYEELAGGFGGPRSGSRRTSSTAHQSSLAAHHLPNTNHQTPLTEHRL